MKYLGKKNEIENIATMEDIKYPFITGTTSNAGDFDFANIVYTGETYYVKFSIEIETADPNLGGIYVTNWCGAIDNGAIVQYESMNKNTSNQPLYYFNSYYPTAEGKLANKPDICGFRVYGDNANIQRNYKIELIECSNCTVTFLNTVTEHTTLTGEENYYNLLNSRAYISSGYRYGSIATAENATQTSNVQAGRIITGKNTVGISLLKMGIDSKYYSLRDTTVEFNLYSSILQSAGTTTADVYTNGVYEMALFNFSTNIQAGTYTPYEAMYIEGDINSNGNFVSTGIYKQQSFITGKIYILVGYMYTAVSLRLIPNNLVYYFDGSNLILYSSVYLKDYVDTEIAEAKTYADTTASGSATVYGMPINSVVGFDGEVENIPQGFEVIDSSLISGSVPIGTILPYSSTELPDGFCLCNGQELSRVEYLELYLVIGTTYGNGDGSTTFNIPNLMGKTIVGLDILDTDFNVIGKTGGSKELQEHMHEVMQRRPNPTPVSSLYNSNYDVGDSNWVLTAGSKMTNTGSSDNLFTDNVGTGDSGNLQPYMALNYIIKVRKSIGCLGEIVNSLNGNSTTDAPSVNATKNYITEVTRDCYITATVSGNHALTEGSIIRLNTVANQVGDKFELITSGTNAYKIKIKAGVSKIKCSANIFAEGIHTTGYVWGQIRKNNGMFSGSIVSSTSGFISSSITTKIINVEENDVISLIGDSTAGGNVRGSSENTWILLEVIE